MNRELWRVSFANLLDKEERKMASKFRSLLKREYNKAIDQAVEAGGMQPMDGLFKEQEIKELYIDLYRTVGMRFASWYEEAYEKLIKKSNGNRSTWATTFAGVGEREAGKKIVIVQGTAKDQIRRVIGGLFKDANFTSEGAVVQGRILRQQFNEITQYQAERIVRTEATNAANQAVMKSATDLFGANVLEKEWIASADERTRNSHRSVDGQIVPYDEPFKVPAKFGVDLMMHPADPNGSAANVINCRCSIAMIPKEDAMLQEGVELEGFGGGLAAQGTRLIGDELVSTAKPAKEVVEEIDSITSGDIKFKSKTDAENYFLKNLGGKFCDFRRVDDRIAYEYVNGVKAVKEVFPEFKLNTLAGLDPYREELGDFIFDKVKKSSAYKENPLGKKQITSIVRKHFGISKRNAASAAYHHTKRDFEWKYFGIKNLNLTKYRGIVHDSLDKFEDMVKDGIRARETQWWSLGSENPRYIAIHEIGHALDYSIMLHKEREFLKYYQSIRSKGEDFRSKAGSRRFKANTYVKENLSEYGSMNEREFIAESVAEYFCSPNPREISRTVVEMLMRYWKKNYNKNLKIDIESTEDYNPIPFGGAHLPTDEYVELPENLDI